MYYDMSTTGLRAPQRTGIGRPTIVKAIPKPKPSGLAKSNSLAKSTSRDLPTPRRPGLKHSSSTHSNTGSLSRSGSTASVSSSIKVGANVGFKDSDLQGVVRYYGEPDFAKGLWVGVELEEPKGKNNGQVKGIQYFQCPDLHGLFCKPEKVVLLASPPTNSSAIMRPTRTPSQHNLNNVDYEAKFGLKVGCKVIVNETKTGILLFLGLTEFAKGVWAGVALDTPDGKNDGSVKGKRYFTCDPGHGLFAQAAKIRAAESPFTSRTSSLSSFETPRKFEMNKDEKVMKPDFSNRATPPNTGISTSLSGILRSKSRDIETMQKDLGDLQQRLNEVNSKTPTNKGVNGTPLSNRTPRSSFEQNSTSELDKLKKQIEESDKEKIELLSKLRLADNDKLLLENSLAELTQNNSEETSRFNQKIDLLNKEMIVLKSSHDAQILQLQTELNRVENELTSALEKGAEYEAIVLSAPDNSTELTESCTKISELQEEVERLTTQLNNYLQRISELEMEATESAERMTSLQQTIADNEPSDVSELEGALTRTIELETEINELKNQLNLTLQQLHEEQANSTSEREKNTQLTESLTEAESTISNLNNQLSQIQLNSNDSLVSATNEASSLREQLETKESIISERTDEISALKTDVEKLTRDYSDLEDQQSRDNDKIKSLEDMLAASQSGSDEQLVEAQKRISELEIQMTNTISTHKTEISSYISQVSDLQQAKSSEADEATAKIEELSRHLAALEESHAKVVTEKTQQSEESSNTISDLQAQVEEYNKLRVEHAAAMATISKHEAELAETERLRTELANAITARDEKEQQLRQAQSVSVGEQSDLQEKLAKSEIRMSELETMLTEHEAKVGRLERDLAESQAQVEAAESELVQLANQIDQKNSLISLITTEKSGADRKIAELEEHRVRLEGQVAQVTSQFNGQSQEETENLHKRINNLTNENEVLRSSVHEKATAFDELTSEVSTLREISETAFTELKKNEVQFNESVKKLKTTQIQLDDALDRTRKLQTKVNDLEEEVVRERARANDLEQRLGPVMTYDEVEDLSNLSNSPLSSPQFVPNRMFCDNCDVFDDHDTDHCPMASSPGGVRHGGHKGLSGRPYCTVCEMFGHTAEECEDDMTF